MNRIHKGKDPVKHGRVATGEQVDSNGRNTKKAGRSTWFTSVHPDIDIDDTIDIASGRRIDIEFISNNIGIWPVNGTKTFHQSNNGESPGGMISRLVYKDYLVSNVEKPVNK